MDEVRPFVVHDGQSGSRDGVLYKARTFNVVELVHIPPDSKLPRQGIVHDQHDDRGPEDKPEPSKHADALVRSPFRGCRTTHCG